MLKKIRAMLARLPLPYLKDPAPVVAVLPLEGPIGVSGRFSSSLNLAKVEKDIEAAFDVYNVKAVALAINSPGGSPVQSDLIMRRIRALSEEKNIPVFAFAEDVAASGGYLLSLAGDEIYAHRASIVGSIGVISAGFGFDKAIEKLGVDRRVYTAGEHKSILDPFQPEQEKDVKIIKGLQNRIHDFFKEIVKERREGKLKGTQKVMFSGLFWTGEEAVKLGLVDGLGDLRTVMREKYGKRTRFKRIQGEKGFLKGLLGIVRRYVPQASLPQSRKLPQEILAALEERAEWSRYGL
ncbi:S49 family peptidase [Luteithermobacter gelatinilyticus]|uniref:S49 family peptidase n=1 Tax=Luteithermobacter gelatinilyticus TaxID=2582913 RepID=UPI0011070D78|nr:S49 family peptidase [Luteithermobacter gelatinilyticus]|tara:strand:- start:148 stop:1029 length:882 start_codon:yes stop_codon:yes gene_type:complete